MHTELLKLYNEFSKENAQWPHSSDKYLCTFMPRHLIYALYSVDTQWMKYIQIWPSSHAFFFDHYFLNIVFSFPFLCFQSAVLQPQASSPPSSLLSLPMLTSTFNELDNPSMSLPPRSPLPRDNYNHGYHCNFSELSSVSQVSLSFSSIFTGSEFSSSVVKCSSTPVMACNIEVLFTTLFRS